VFTVGEDETSVSTSNHSGLLPQKLKLNSSQRKMGGQKDNEGHRLQIHLPNSHAEIAHTP